jgi:hypothetical protein
MRKSSLVFLVAAALCSAPAFAQVGAANNPVTTTASPVRTSMGAPVANPQPTGYRSLDEIACRDEPPPTGSRIGGSHVCKTQREWLAQDDALNRARGVQDQATFNSIKAVPFGGH